jgi:spermidine synthase
MLAQLMSLLEGHTVFFYGLTIGIYIFGLGIGSLMSTAAADVTTCLKKLVHLEIQLATLGACSPLLLTSLQTFAPSLRHHALGLLPTIGLIFWIAWLSGRELPWLLRIAELQGQENWVTRLIAIDYLASFVGALAFPLWVFPELGIVSSALALGLFNLLAVFLLLKKDSEITLVLKTSLGIIVGLVLWSFSDPVSLQLTRILSEGAP